MPTDVKVSCGAGQVMNNGMLWWSGGQQGGPTPTVITPPILAIAIVGVAAVYVGGTYANATGVNVQWLKNGSVIAGATNSTYTPILGDLGAALSVQETPFNASGNGTPQTTLGITVTL